MTLTDTPPVTVNDRLELVNRLLPKKEAVLPCIHPGPARARIRRRPAADFITKGEDAPRPIG